MITVLAVVVVADQVVVVVDDVVVLGCRLLFLLLTLY